MEPVGRNDPCPCGSGKKYKKCCEEKNQAQTHEALEKQWNEGQKAAAAQEEQEAAKPGSESRAPAGRKKDDRSRAVPQRHQAFVGPKITMPRKSGGG